ncbi:CD109 antigen-like [Gastrophryne carolinensis]
MNVKQKNLVILPSFHIIAPSNIYDGTEITLAVHWFGEHSEINVTARVTTSNNSTDILSSNSKIFYNDWFLVSSVDVKREFVSPLMLNDTQSQYYKLIVEGSVENQMLFYYENMLEFLEKNISIFVQTDKKAYRPGETVKFRVVAVDSELRPYNGDISVIIKDPQENIIHQWLKQRPDLGVVSLELLLTKNPTTGSWKINILTQVGFNFHLQLYAINSAGLQKTNWIYFSYVRWANMSPKVLHSSITEYFLVDEGVLPKFDVTMKVPSVYIDPNQPGISGLVSAKYPYGKPVVGNLTVSVVPTYSYGMSYEVNKTFEISGSANFSFEHMELLDVMMWGLFNITASVTEELTGITVSATACITRVYAEYMFIMKGFNGLFIPGTNYKAKIKLVRADQEPLSTEENESSVSLKITQSPNFWWWWGFNIAGTYVTEQNITLQDSILRLEFEVHPTAELILIEAAYRNSTQTWYLYKSYGKNTDIQIQELESPAEVGTPFQMVIDVYPEVEELFYVVMAKGLIVSAGRQNRTSFGLTPEQSWTPYANLILYFSDANGYGDIVQTSYMFSVKGMFQNKVALSWSENRIKPSENVSLSIDVTEARSLVGLQVISKDATLVGGEKDFSAHKVEETFRSFIQLWGYNTLSDGIISTYYLPIEYQPIESSIQVTTPASTHWGALFAETWIWLETNISSRGTFNLPFSTPDSMTSWIANAFVISDTLGLGFTEKPAELEVFQNLSVKMNLPYSVIRGEVFILEVVLFNHLEENLEVSVFVEESDSFEIVESINGSTVNYQALDIASQEVKSCLFPIKPVKLGEIPVMLKAVSEAASEHVIGKTIVKAEGIKKFHSESILFDLKADAGPNLPHLKSLSFTFPSDVVEGSEEAYINVLGNPLVSSIDGLESLIQMPCGCGEQNMIFLAPNIYVLEYLQATNQANEYITARAIENMQQGYQNELYYRRNDGSFSAFGNWDQSGSTWLSAFVFRCFLQARPFIYVDPDVLNKTVSWLVQYQDISTGIFSEPGHVIHYELQGGLNGPITLTAYILTSLLEDEYYRQIYEYRIQKAVEYLEEKFDEGITSNYTLSVVTYALTMAKSSKAEAALEQLNARAMVTSGSKYWSSPSENQNYYYWQPRTTDIETASYALLSYYHQDKIADGLLVMKWLSQQRNSLGGFISTQDTVMALHALSKFMLFSNFNETSVTLSVTGPQAFKPKVFEINSENHMVLQSEQVEIFQHMSINVTATGRGLVVVQLNVIYNLKATSKFRSAAASEAFSLDVTVIEDNNNAGHLVVETCTSYLGKWNQSGMVIQDVRFLSGFTLSPEGIPVSGIIKKVDVGDENVYIYLDSVSAQQVCISVPMVRSAKVADSQDVLIRVYDYYNPSDFASRIYNSKSSNLCDVCGSDCDFCKVDRLDTTEEGSNSGAFPEMSLFCITEAWVYTFGNLIPSYECHCRHPRINSMLCRRQCQGIVSEAVGSTGKPILSASESFVARAYFPHYH